MGTATAPQEENVVGSISSSRETEGGPSITPTPSERGTCDDHSWIQSFGEYRRENEQCRAARAAEIQRASSYGLEKR